MLFLVVFSAAAIMCSTSCTIIKAPDKPVVLGIPGQLSDVRTEVPAADKVTPLSSARLPTDIDLKRMAQWSLNYLIETPRKEFDYEPVFGADPTACPPYPDTHDPTVPCDTDARMDWEWYYMRDICGSSRGKDVEAGFHQRMRNYIAEDGKIWTATGASGVVVDQKLISIWGATKILKSLSEDYMRAENPGYDPAALQTRSLARKIMLALKKMAKWEPNGQCWYVCGHAFLNEDGSVGIPNLGWNAYPAPIVMPLVTYWQATGDDEALQFARAFADGVIAGAQPDGVRFEPDGDFTAHTHGTLHAVWGFASLGNITGQKKYVDFAKRVWDRFLPEGTGTGWYPALLPTYPTGETCCVADVIGIALEIAAAGYPEYFDFAERDMRNRISPSQFIITPEFETFYREKNKSAGEENLKEGLRKLKKLQGGFHSDIGINEIQIKGYSNERSNYAHMFGCCVPEGMRATYMIWRNTIDRLPASALGPAGVYVNMSFSRDSKWGQVVSFMPREGRLTVKTAVKDKFLLRPPRWAPRDQVNAFINSEPAPVKWSGNYVKFVAQPGDELTITYPLITFKHSISGLWEKYEPGRRFTFTWRGNMVIDVEPAAEGTVLFTGKPRILPPAPGEETPSK